MSVKSFYHQMHGDRLHDLVRYLVEYYIVSKGGRLMDRETFKKKHYLPCEPDVIFQFLEKGTKYIYVVEVETNPTKESVAKKSAQYMDSTAGITDLVVLDLSKMKDHEQVNWLLIDKFIKERMPL